MFVPADKTRRIFMPEISTPLFAGIPYTRLAWTHDLTGMCSQRLGAVMSLPPLGGWRGKYRPV